MRLHILLFFIFIMGCTGTNIGGEAVKDIPMQSIASNNINVDMHDCKDSEECFEKHVQVCSPVTATITIGDLSYKEEVIGYENGECILTVEYLKSPVPDYTGKSMRCRVSKDHLDNFKEHIGGPNMLKYCTGTMINYIMQAQGYMSNAGQQY